MSRAAAVLAIIVGLFLIGFTFAVQLFPRSSDAQVLADRYRPLMSKAGLADLRHGFDALVAAGDELSARAEPALQAQLGMSDAEFAAYERRRLPGVVAFDEQAPAVVKLVDPVIRQMQAGRVDYERADSIPIGFLNFRSAPWLFLGIGLAFVAVGVFALVRPSTLATVALLVVGLGVALAPVVLDIPSKVDAAVRTTDLGRAGLAPSTGRRAVASVQLFDAMVEEVRTAVAPTIGEADFDRDFPKLATFADQWERTNSAKSHALSDSQVALASTFANADKIPLEPIPWLFIVPGAVIAALAGASLVPALRRRAEPAVAQPAA
ncbi:MAG TPA: hypothetical protein VIH82_06440 [Acidimicrobiia bacterium]